MVFGGRSVEHEISVLTAHQAMAALPAGRYTPVPIYISKAGQWFTGDVLRDLDGYRDLDKLVAAAEPVTLSVDPARPGLIVQREGQRRGLFGGRSPEQTTVPIDVAFPLVHGSHGEDGTLQGLFELADLPYVGSDVAASAVGIDKVLSKVVLRAASVPVLDDVHVTRREWEQEPERIVAEVESRFGYPVFVKPVSLGSSIAVARADDGAALRFAVDVAASYDNRIMIEPAQQDIVEINCAVLQHGNEARPSVCEQPLSGTMLSYEDKYLTGGQSKGMKGARRRIPAPLDDELTAAIQATAVRAFTALGAAGVARVDFLVNQQAGTFVVNELNTLPGSLAFYLWEPAGVPFGELLTTLIDGALTRHQDKRRSTYSFNSSLLQHNPLQAAKGGAGQKVAAQAGAPR
jgi:D-alanine-D-alanine ligase